MLKKYLYLHLFFSVTFFSNSQTFEDALRYSSFYHEGTSRFNSMGGAFGSLGGDLSAISINPASSSIFLDSEISVTLNYKNFSISNELNNYNSLSKKNFYSYGGLGFVLVYENRKSRFSLSYNNHRLGDFNSSFNLSGKNSSGIDNYFLYYAEGIPSEDLLIYDDETSQSVYTYLGDNYGFADQQAFLGFQSFIINNNGEDNSNYISNALYNNLDQNLEIFRKGDHFKHSVNFGYSFNNHFFTGININLHETLFEETKIFEEYGYANDSNVQRIFFKEDLLAFGTGFSVQLGSIIKIKQLRVGLSYSTPTILNIEEESSQLIETDISENNKLTTYIIDPNTINIYDKYEIKLPSKSLFSLAYIFGTRGLISFDYEITKFNNTEFDDNDGKDSYLNSLNYSIKNKMAAISESIRIGGEYLYKNLNLRAGYFYYKGPDLDLKNKVTGLTAGIGINYGYFDLDIGITKSNNFIKNRLYTRGLTDKYDIDADTFAVYASFSIKL
tara:strand:- start:1819 stop:3318 length:1500 start_codon:yes stop_codon:yes gene_type:complete